MKESELMFQNFSESEQASENQKQESNKCDSA